MIKHYEFFQKLLEEALELLNKGPKVPLEDKTRILTTIMCNGFDELYDEDCVNREAISMNFFTKLPSKEPSILANNLYTFVLMCGECPPYYEWINEEEYVVKNIQYYRLQNPDGSYGFSRHESMTDEERERAQKNLTIMAQERMHTKQKEQYERHKPLISDLFNEVR